MKKVICILCALALLLSLGACAKKSAGVFPKPEDVTIEALKDQTSPMGMLAHAGGFEIQWRDDDAANAGAYASTTIMRYRYDGELIQINQIADYDDGDHTLLYFTSDLKDPTLFVENAEGYSVSTLSDREIQNSLDQSLFGLDSLDCEITSAKKTADGYQIEYDAGLNGAKTQHVTMDVDPESGAVKGAFISFYQDGAAAGESKVTISYSNDVQIDTTPRDKAIEQGLYDPEQAKAKAESATSGAASKFSFAAYDLDGNLVSFNDLAGAKLIMINFWEPWCQPCVEEMPDLELLYEDYKDAGLMILGVFSTEGEDENVRAVLKEAGTTYPIVRCDNHLALYQTDSVPTTILVDGQGNVLTDEPFIGSRSYEDWLAIVSEYMQAIDAQSETE